MNTEDLISTFYPPAQHQACNLGKNSFFLSFEGIEGSGKTTQIQQLTKYLTESGHSVHCFREPGGTEFGEKMRKAILTATNDIGPLAEAHLFAASRAQLLEKEIIPLLSQDNQIVIVDRFLDSSLAYQGHARGLGIKTILEIHQHSPLNLVPDLSFYLRINLQTSLQRQKQRGQDKDYFESKAYEFHQQLIQGFDLAAQTFPERIKIIDGQHTPHQVTTTLIAALQEVLQDAAES